MTYHSQPPPSAGDPWQHTIEAVVGIAMTRRQLAQETVDRGLKVCSDEVAALSEECRAHLRTEGALAAWTTITDMLKLHIRATMEELNPTHRRQP